MHYIIEGLIFCVQSLLCTFQSWSFAYISTHGIVTKFMTLHVTTSFIINTLIFLSSFWLGSLPCSLNPSQPHILVEEGNHGCSSSQNEVTKAQLANWGGRGPEIPKGVAVVVGVFADAGRVRHHVRDVTLLVHPAQQDRLGTCNTVLKSSIKKIL